MTGLLTNNRGHIIEIVINGHHDTIRNTMITKGLAFDTEIIHFRPYYAVFAVIRNVPLEVEKKGVLKLIQGMNWPLGGPAPLSKISSQFDILIDGTKIDTGRWLIMLDAFPTIKKDSSNREKFYTTAYGGRTIPFQITFKRPPTGTIPDRHNYTKRHPDTTTTPSNPEAAGKQPPHPPDPPKPPQPIQQQPKPPQETPLQKPQKDNNKKENKKAPTTTQPSEGANNLFKPQNRSKGTTPPPTYTQTPQQQTKPHCTKPPKYLDAETTQILVKNIPLGHKEEWIQKTLNLRQHFHPDDYGLMILPPDSKKNSATLELPKYLANQLLKRTGMEFHGTILRFTNSRFQQLKGQTRLVLENVGPDITPSDIKQSLMETHGKAVNKVAIHKQVPNVVNTDDEAEVSSRITFDVPTKEVEFYMQPLRINGTTHVVKKAAIKANVTNKPYLPPSTQGKDHLYDPLSSDQDMDIQDGEDIQFHIKPTDLKNNCNAEPQVQPVDNTANTETDVTIPATSVEPPSPTHNTANHTLDNSTAINNFLGFESPAQTPTLPEDHVESPSPDHRHVQTDTTSVMIDIDDPLTDNSLDMEVHVPAEADVLMIPNNSTPENDAETNTNAEQTETTVRTETETKTDGRRYPLQPPHPERTPEDVTPPAVRTAVGTGGPPTETVADTPLEAHQGEDDHRQLGPEGLHSHSEEEDAETDNRQQAALNVGCDVYNEQYVTDDDHLTCGQKRTTQDNQQYSLHSPHPKETPEYVTPSTIQTTVAIESLPTDNQTADTDTPLQCAQLETSAPETLHSETDEEEAKTEQVETEEMKGDEGDKENAEEMNGERDSENAEEKENEGETENAEEEEIEGDRKSTEDEGESGEEEEMAEEKRVMSRIPVTTQIPIVIGNTQKNTKYQSGPTRHLPTTPTVKNTRTHPTPVKGHKTSFTTNKRKPTKHSSAEETPSRKKLLTSKRPPVTEHPTPTPQQILHSAYNFTHGKFQFETHPDLIDKFTHRVFDQERKLYMKDVINLLISHKFVINSLACNMDSQLNTKDGNDLATYLLYVFVGSNEVIPDTWPETLGPIPPQILKKWKTWCAKGKSLTTEASRYTALLKQLTMKEISQSGIQKLKNQQNERRKPLSSK